MPDPMARILLLGATGQIGAQIVAQSDAHEFVAFARRPEIVPAHSGVLVNRFEATHPLPELGEIPVAGAIATVPVWLLPPRLDDLARLGVRRLVCFSTSSVFGKAETRSRRERAVVARVTAAEATLRDWSDACGVALTILQPTMIYGAGKDRTIAAAARFIQRFGFFPVYGSATGARQPVHAGDLAAAALAALSNDRAIGKTYMLGGGETLAYRDMIARIFDTLGRTPRITRVPALPTVLSVAGAILSGSELTGDVARRMNADLAFDDGSATRDFGYAPRKFLNGGMADLFGSALRA
jgi:nucleoside-diphosphate-sugar epimerase